MTDATWTGMGPVRTSQMAFGWATILLFGRVPQRNKMLARAVNELIR